MERSDDYIDFKAYIRYLKKVTGDPADPEALRKAILEKTAGQTEMQTAYVILKRLTLAAAVVLLVVFCSSLYGYFSGTEVLDEQELWTDARMDERGRTPASRLYEAYRNSSEIRERFF